MKEKNVLVLNAGSSTLKFALIHPETGEQRMTGLADKLSTPDAMLTATILGEAYEQPIPSASINTALAKIFPLVSSRFSIVAVGHRVVHGGATCQQPLLIDGMAIRIIQRLESLAPLHNPLNLAGIEAAQVLLPDVPQVAVFDTAFHHTLPEKAYRYAVPEHWYKTYGIRRFGFHGTSHQFVGEQAALALNKPFDKIQLVTAHLGNGCSLCAIKHGQSVDTTMGMTPLEGLMMGTRSGDIDPGIIFYLAQQEDLPIKEIESFLNTKSGLLGVSQLSNDLRELEQASKEGDTTATLAIEMFCYRIAKSIAAMSVALDDLDALIFTGGIGENSVQIRAKVVSQLKLLNLSLDEQKNRQGSLNIGQTSSRPVLVIKTDEEWMIAKQTFNLVETQ